MPPRRLAFLATFAFAGLGSASLPAHAVSPQPSPPSKFQMSALPRIGYGAADHAKERKKVVVPGTIRSGGPQPIPPRLR